MKNNTAQMYLSAITLFFGLSEREDHEAGSRFALKNRTVRTFLFISESLFFWSVQ